MKNFELINALEKVENEIIKHSTTVRVRVDRLKSIRYKADGTFVLSFVELTLEADLVEITLSKLCAKKFLKKILPYQDVYSYLTNMPSSKERIFTFVEDTLWAYCAKVAPRHIKKNLIVNEDAENYLQEIQKAHFVFSGIERVVKVKVDGDEYSSIATTYYTFQHSEEEGLADLSDIRSILLAFPKHFGVLPSSDLWEFLMADSPLDYYSCVFGKHTVSIFDPEASYSLDEKTGLHKGLRIFYNGQRAAAKIAFDVFLSSSDMTARYLVKRDIVNKPYTDIARVQADDTNCWDIFNALGDELIFQFRKVEHEPISGEEFYTFRTHIENYKSLTAKATDADWVSTKGDLILKYEISRTAKAYLTAAAKYIYLFKAIGGLV